MAAKTLTQVQAATRVKVYGLFNFAFRAVVPGIAAIVLWGAFKEPTEPSVPAWLASIMPASFEAVYFQALDVLKNLAFGTFAAGGIILLEMKDRVKKTIDEYKVKKQMVFAKNRIAYGIVGAVVSGLAYLVALKLLIFCSVFAGSSAIAYGFEIAQNKCKLIAYPNEVAVRG